MLALFAFEGISRKLPKSYLTHPEENPLLVTSVCFPDANDIDYAKILREYRICEPDRYLSTYITLKSAGLSILAPDLSGEMSV